MLWVSVEMLSLSLHMFNSPSHYLRDMEAGRRVLCFQPDPSSLAFDRTQAKVTRELPWGSSPPISPFLEVIFL